MRAPRNRCADSHTLNIGVAPGQRVLHPTNYPRATSYVIVPTMRLADRIAQCRTPFIVQNMKDGSSCALERRSHVRQRDPRVSDSIRTLRRFDAFMRGPCLLERDQDLGLRRPAACARRTGLARMVRGALASLSSARYGFKTDEQSIVAGRRGALIHSCATGRRGLIRTFWANGDSELDVLASSMEAYFDFDTPDGEAPAAPDGSNRASIGVFDRGLGEADILRRCFRFRYERTWAEYYANSPLAPEQRDAVARHALGTIAIEIPLMLTFFLLLATRPGLPRRPLILERINRARSRSGKAPLLEHMEVFAPLIPEYRSYCSTGSSAERRPPRLHHVRGHLVRRGSQLFWRVPHLRGSCRAGVVRTRTVTWTLDGPIDGAH